MLHGIGEKRYIIILISNGDILVIILSIYLSRAVYSGIRYRLFNFQGEILITINKAYCFDARPLIYIDVGHDKRNASRARGLRL